MRHVLLSVRLRQDHGWGRNGLVGGKLWILVTRPIFLQLLLAAGHHHEDEHHARVLPLRRIWNTDWLEPQLDCSDSRFELFPNSCFCLCFLSFNSFFFQNAVLQIQRAHAQTLKLLTASTSLPLPESTAAAASAWILRGSVLLVDLARPLELDSGKSCHFVL